MDGDAFFFGVDPPGASAPQTLEIPDEQGRICPQCGVTAWAQTRWCWRCGFDFDRRSLPRYCAHKLLFLSVLANVILGGALVLALLKLA